MYNNWDRHPDSEVSLQQDGSLDVSWDKQVIFQILDMAEGGNTVPGPHASR